jgi:hypothetical protein
MRISKKIITPRLLWVWLGHKAARQGYEAVTTIRVLTENVI